MSSTEKVRNTNNSTSITLEKFMVKLCTPHQKQFINVLNNICTEDSSSQENSTITSNQQNIEFDSKEYTKPIFDSSLLHLNNLVCHPPANSPTDLDIKNSATDCSGNQAFLGLGPEFLTATERLSPVCCSMTKCTLLNCSFLSTDQGEQTTGKKIVLCMKTSEEQYQIHNVICQTNFTESCFAPQKHSLKDLPNDTEDPKFVSAIPNIADKENALWSSAKSLLLHAVESDCKLKQASPLNTTDSSEVGNLLINGDIDSLECCHRGSVSLPSSSKNGLQEDIKPYELARKCKRSDEKLSDNQNFVYTNHQFINEPRLENQNAELYTGTAEGYCSALQLVANVGIPEALSEDFISLTSYKESNEQKEPLTTMALADPSSKNLTETQLESQAIETACGSWKVTTLGQAENDTLCIGPITISNLSPGNLGEGIIQYVNEGVKSNSNFGLIITPGLMCNAGKSIAYENVPITLIQKHSADVNSASSIKPAVFNTSSAIEESQPTTDEAVSYSCVSDVQENNIFTPIRCSNLGNSENLLQYVTFSVEGRGSEQCTDTAGVSSFCKGDLGIPEIHVEKCPVLKNLGTLELLHKTIGCSTLTNIKGRQMFDHMHIDSNSELGAVPGNIVESALLNESDHFSSEFSGNVAIKREYLSEGSRTDEDNTMVKRELKDKCPEMLESIQLNLRCSTAANNLDESSMIISIKEDIPRLLSSSAEDSVDGPKKETAIKEVQNCDITTLAYEQNQRLNSFVTKSLSEEKTVNTYNLKSENSFNDDIHTCSMSLKKKSKKVPAPSDRCLRSQQTQESVKNCTSDIISDKMESPNLQVNVSMLPGTNVLQRVVEVRGQTMLKSTLNSHQNCVQNFCDKTIDNSECKKNDPGLILKNIPGTEKVVFSDNCLSNKMSLRCKRKEKVKLCVDSKESIYVPLETGGLISTDDKSGIVQKVNTQALTATSHSFRTSKENKSRAKKMALWNHSLAPLSMENTNNHKKTNKPQRIAQQDSLNAVNLNETDISNKPKFVDWCSEEENQELIANFNTKYMSLHKRWIQLDKEVPNVQKSKNKSDKLKEIWKTKKRLRKNRSTQESQKCSAMQVLFLSTLKISEICKCFLETTETKSLVIVKKINTRLPEDLPLPIFPLPKYPPSISYTHMLQAERLKKHLKKFASVFPARNNHKTKEELVNVFNDNELQPGRSGFDGKGKCDTKQELGIKNVKSLVKLNNPAGARGEKWNSVHGKSLSLMYENKHGVSTKERKSNLKTSNRKDTDAKLTRKITKAMPKLETLSSDKQRGQKRSKEYLIKAGAHLKKRRTEVKCSAETMLSSSLPAKKVIKTVKLDSDISAQKKEIANTAVKSSKNACLKNEKKTSNKVSGKVQHASLTCSAKKANQIKPTNQNHFLCKITKNQRTAEKILTRSLSKRGFVPPQQKRNHRSKLDSTKPIKRSSFQVK